MRELTKEQIEQVAGAGGSTSSSPYGLPSSGMTVFDPGHHHDGHQHHHKHKHHAHNHQHKKPVRVV